MEVTGWDAAAALAKALTYAATLSAAGTTFFLGYTAQLLRTQQRHRIVRVILLLAPLAAVASITRVSLLAASMSDNLAGMFDLSFAGMILRAGEGRAILLRIAGLVLCTAAFKSGRFWSWVAWAGAMLAAASFAVVGHVHALQPNRLATVILMLHLWCGAFWLGALWPLLQVARHDDPLTAALAARFGRIALYLVGVLLAAGTLLACRLLGGLAALWSSDYGRMLSLKILLVAAMLCAAAVNKLRLTPRLAAGDARAAAHLRRSVTFEMGLGGAILLVTALFTSLTGP